MPQQLPADPVSQGEVGTLVGSTSTSVNVLLGVLWSSLPCVRDSLGVTHSLREDTVGLGLSRACFLFLMSLLKANIKSTLRAHP